MQKCGIYSVNKMLAKQGSSRNLVRSTLFSKWILLSIISGLIGTTDK